MRDRKQGATTMKRNVSLLIAGVLALAVVMVPSLAFANYGPHGSYLKDSDVCKTCHSAHNAPSSLMWTDPNGKKRSTLLNAPVAQLGEFCFTCHGASAQGADTNVQDGVYEARASAGALGEPGKPLNGGDWGKWATPAMAAQGSMKAQRITMDCGVCHDVHGSSNYRLLKGDVLGSKVGGYDAAENPTPFVLSAEKGFPSGGFNLHEAANGYTPNYTTSEQAKPPADDPTKGISGWCGSCHKFGAGSTHFHPYNVPLSSWAGPVMNITNNPFPLAHDRAEGADGSKPTVSASDWITCLTCHKAHTPHGNTTSDTQYPALCQTCHQF